MKMRRKVQPQQRKLCEKNLNDFNVKFKFQKEKFVDFVDTLQIVLVDVKKNRILIEFTLILLN